MAASAVIDPGLVALHLPDDVWAIILGNLKARQKCNLRATCKRFRQLVNATVLKIKLDPTNSEQALSWQLHSRFPQLTHIELIKPSEVDCFTDQTFAQLALKDLAYMSHLTSLNLENCTQLSVAGMAAIALTCTKLKSLTVPQVCQLCMSDSMLLVLSKLPELSKLRVQCCKHCDEVTLSHLSDLKRLTALELEDYGQALRQVTKLTCLTNLQSVMVWSDISYDVSEAMMHGMGMGMLNGNGGNGNAPAHNHHQLHHLAPLPAGAAEAAMQALANLHLNQAGPLPGGNGAVGNGGDGAGHHHNHHLDGHDLALMQQQQQHHGAGANGGGGGGGGIMLVGAGGGGVGGVGGGNGGAGAAQQALHVMLNGLNQWGAAGGAGDVVLAAAAAAGEDGDAEALVHQLHVTEQVLSNIAEGKNALLEWVTGMRQLTHVDIQRVDIDHTDLERLAALPGLKHLGVGDLNMVEEPCQVLSPVTKLVSHNILNEAYLRTVFPSLRALSCDASDSGLTDIAELRGLVNLFLWNSPSDGISDRGLAMLSTMTSLDTFRLEGTDAVTDAGWVKFTEHHTSLTRVDLVRCPMVTDIGFILSIKQLPRLQRISFMECPGIDMPTLAALLAFCTRLELVELQDCPSITQANIRGLLSTIYRPDLDIVYRKGGATRTLHC